MDSMSLRDMLFWVCLATFETGMFVTFDQHVGWGIVMIAVGLSGMIGCAWPRIKAKNVQPKYLWGIGIVTILALVASVITGLYSHYYVNKENHAPVVTAPSVAYVDFIHTALQVDPRARKVFAAGKPLTLTVMYKVTGGVAQKVYPGLGLTFIAPGPDLGAKEEDKFKELRDTWLPHALSAQGEDIGPDEPPKMVDVSTPHVLPKEAIEDLEGEETLLYFFGTIKWTDDLGTWETQWCSHLLVKRSDLKTGVAVWKECESGAKHNFIRHAFVTTSQ